MDNGKFFEGMVPMGDLIGIKFDLLTEGDMENFSVMSIDEVNDLIDPKLGIPNSSGQCSTCGFSGSRYCDGHSGVIKLPATIYHPYLVREIVQILNKICPGCKRIRQKRENKGSLNLTSIEPSMEDEVLEVQAIFKEQMDLQRSAKFIRKYTLPIRITPNRGVKGSVSYFDRRNSIKKGLHTLLKEGNLKKLINLHSRNCKYCGVDSDGWYPRVKFKVSKDVFGKGLPGIIVEVDEIVPKKFCGKPLSEVLPKDFWDFIPKDLQEGSGMTTDKIILLPYQAFHILKDLNQNFIEKYVSRRDSLFLSSFPVTPNGHRVIETMHACPDGPRLMFDERTKAYKRLTNYKRMIVEFGRHDLIGDQRITCVGSDLVQDCVKVSKISTIKSSSRDSAAYNSGLKWIKEIVLGKRTDCAYRMTVVGDPKIGLGEIGIPFDISEELYIPQHVNLINRITLRKYSDWLLNRKSEYYVRRKGDIVPIRHTHELQVGDVFYRHLKDGDLVLVNRPPSVHQHSVIAFTVKVLPIKSVISINPLCCAPFLGDFDGDCLHGFIPQSINCRVELGELMTLDHQLLNGQDGRPLVSLSHDALTAAHLVTRKNIFMDRFEMQQLQMLCPRQLQFPAVVEAPSQAPLWTGKQFFSMLLPDELDYVFTRNEVLVRNGEMLCSSGESGWLHNSSGSIFHGIFKFFHSRALNYLFCAQDALCEWISTMGLSVSLSDIYLSTDSYSRMKMIDEVNCGLQEVESLSYTKLLMLDQIASFREVFRDLKNVIRVHANKENSILSMIDAGSKGSLAKLVQLCACLGLQHFRGLSSFKIPCKLSCAHWNQLKGSEFPVEAPGTLESAPGDVCHVIVKSSFISGLNPLECFVHALSNRGNVFSDNAEIPGTLARKLMFYLRDLYIAYDGTVRSAYGDQIIQFSYGCTEESFVGDISGKKTFEEVGIAGQSIGAVVASSFSEAAYSALDCPVISLETSPLLNLKKSLECAGKQNVADRSISLFLSKKLEKWLYGAEYGAIEVKNHLERVFLSDLVATVMIVFAEENISASRFTPWVSHFHICKERMNKRGLSIGFLIDVLSREYHSCGKSSSILPNLQILRRDCSLSDAGRKENGTYCVTVEVEICADYVPQLVTVRDTLIPILLQTVVTGFLEFKKVDILWEDHPKPSMDSSGQLFLKVLMSESCDPGKFWGALLIACGPVADLIDWERSRPDSIHDLCCVYGIDAAWKFFLDSLKSTISDIGRSICEEHLLLLADCLSTTGQFHGLTAKGLKCQQNQISVSSPFMLAYFSEPSDCFVRAAKEGIVDDLLGTLEAISWGKKAPIGTGGPFEILYSHPEPNPAKTEGLYDTLCKSQSISRGTFQQKVGLCFETNTEKYTVHKGHANLGCESPTVLKSFEPRSDVMHMYDSLRNILHKYSMNDHLNEEDKAIVVSALYFHPQRNVKMGTGIQEIKIGYNSSYPNSRCFVLVRNDGSSDDFSYRKCVQGRAKQISPALAIEFGNRFFQRRF